MAVRMSIDVAAAPRLTACFNPLIISGVGVEAAAGTPVRRFLVDDLGVEAGYLAASVQTILLDGKAVDNLDEALLHEGAVLALSAAMPGLAGAVLRSRGVLRGLRREISLSGGPAEPAGGRRVTVTVKLFNAVLRDLGGLLLERGVTVAARDLRERLDGCRDELHRAGAVLLLDGRPVEGDAALAFSGLEGPVHLRVKGHRR